MTLSPAAEAVVDAWITSTLTGESSMGCVAAALRAAVEQVLPEMQEPDWGACDQMSCDIELYTDHQRKRAELLAIATELVTHQ
jgi:hypothetical protein